MSQPVDQAEQQKLIQDIGRAAIAALPPRWREATLEYRAVGSHSELAVHLVAPNGTIVPLAAPAEAAPLFANLRDAMYKAERGTWISAVYRLQRPGSYSVDFNGDFEPAWRNPPALGEFAEELRRYPRAPATIPEWLVDRAKATAPTEQHA